MLQSSCTKPELEAESSPVNDMHEFSPLKCGEAHPSGARTQDVDTCIQLGQTSIIHDTHVGGKFLSLSAIILLSI